MSRTTRGCPDEPERIQAPLHRGRTDIQSRGAFGHITSPCPAFPNRALGHEKLRGKHVRLAFETSTGVAGEIRPAAIDRGRLHTLMCVADPM
jgi:hypothetical protein